MRADRLVSLVLLLRQRGRMTAPSLARELEVSTRTVLRDVDALSAAGVPIYAERGRHGGFVLLPGLRTELTGLTHDEALALLGVGSGPVGTAFGLEPALASALRKVVDALPGPNRAVAQEATRRLLVEPETDLLSRRSSADVVPEATMGAIRSAVVSGRRLRIRYATPGEDPRWRTVDPVGLVTVRGRGYLLAIADGADRTYRLSRVSAAEVLDEPALRPAQVDLESLWRERCAQFLAQDHLAVEVRVSTTRRDELLDAAVAVRNEAEEADGWVRLEVTFQDLRHAVWALWGIGPDAEAVAPSSVRAAVHERAALMATRYG